MSERPSRGSPRHCSGDMYLRSTDDRAHRRQVHRAGREVEQSGEAEVADLYLKAPVVGNEDDVVRFDVSVDDLMGVRFRERRAHLPHDVERRARVEPLLLLEELAKRLALDQLLNDVGVPVLGDAEVVGCDDVLMVEPTRCLRLALDARERNGIDRGTDGQHFDRDGVADEEASGPVDRPDAARADAAPYQVLPVDRDAGERSHALVPFGRNGRRTLLSSRPRRRQHLRREERRAATDTESGAVGIGVVARGARHVVGMLLHCGPLSVARRPLLPSMTLAPCGIYSLTHLVRRGSS